MVAAVPAPLSRLPSDSTGNSIGLYYPLLGRLQHVASGHVSGERGTLASGDRPPAGLHADQQSSEQNIGGPAREGNITFWRFQGKRICFLAPPVNIPCNIVVESYF